MLRLTRLVFMARVSCWPVPNRFAWLTEPCRMMPSPLEKPTPKSRLPVGFSTTRMLTSTWSVVPATGSVPMVTSLKNPRRSTRSREFWSFWLS